MSYHYFGKKKWKKWILEEIWILMFRPDPYPIKKKIKNPDSTKTSGSGGLRICTPFGYKLPEEMR